MLKVKIDFKSIIKKGIKSKNDDFLIALVNGKQGSGKTYYVVYAIEEIYKKPLTVFTNIKSYCSLKNKVNYFSRIEDLYNLNTSSSFVIIDECSRRWNKNSPIDTKFYAWLQQCRKNHRYVYLIFQEYMQVPNWLRGVASLSYTTKKLPFLPLMVTTLGIPTLTEDYEWGLTELALRIYKRNKYISKKYDTYETIEEL